MKEQQERCKDALLLDRRSGSLTSVAKSDWESVLVIQLFVTVTEVIKFHSTEQARSSKVRVLATHHLSQFGYCSTDSPNAENHSSARLQNVPPCTSNSNSNQEHLILWCLSRKHFFNNSWSLVLLATWWKTLLSTHPKFALPNSFVFRFILSHSLSDLSLGLARTSCCCNVLGFTRWEGYNHFFLFRPWECGCSNMEHLSWSALPWIWISLNFTVCIAD